MPTPRGFGLGHRPGLAPSLRGTWRQLFGDAPQGLDGNVDFTPCIDRVRDQGQRECCVGMAFARATHVRAQLETGGANWRHHDYPSELGIYAMARELEMPQGSTAPLQDQGSIPGLALQALEGIGVPLEKDWPFSEDVNARPPADVVAKAEAMRVTGAYGMSQQGSARVDACVQALLAGYPFTMAIQVGPNYENAPNDTYVRPLPPEAPNAPIYGGHDISIVGVATVNGRRQFLNCGSWGESWGSPHYARFQGGFAWLDEDWIADPRSTDFFVLTVTPGLLPAASDP